MSPAKVIQESTKITTTYGTLIGIIVAAATTAVSYALISNAIADTQKRVEVVEDRVMKKTDKDHDQDLQIQAAILGIKGLSETLEEMRKQNAIDHQAIMNRLDEVSAAKKGPK